VLRNGSMPLEILERVVNDYIEEGLSSSGNSDPAATRQGGGEPVPAGEWPVSTPEEQGMDSQVLAAMLDEIYREEPGIDAVTVVRNGHLILDATVSPFVAGEKHVINSCTKSIVSALIGIAIAQGHIEGVDQSVLELLPGRTVANLDARKEAMTLEHLLTMTSGLDCQDSYLYQWRGLGEMRNRDDWVQYQLDLPMVAEPGTIFEYCNGASFLLSAILQQATGLSAAEFAQENLFGPLGISDLDWPANPDGISIGWGGIEARPHDLAKIGHLYLNHGAWAGEQLVPSAWVEVSTAKYIPATLQGGYGYQWWIDDSGSYYMALGYAGQFLFVVPGLDMVVVFVSDLDDRDFYVPQDLLVRYILPSARSSEPLPANRAGTELLQVRLAALAAQ
jgi:CubicO group peptidase (beta-lactamase class C family)